jgi:hypothetical protein
VFSSQDDRHRTRTRIKGDGDALGDLAVGADFLSLIDDIEITGGRLGDGMLICAVTADGEKPGGNACADARVDAFIQAFELQTGCAPPPRGRPPRLVK